ncbi:Tn3 family transposase [Paraburkholderia sediminicola]
MIRELKSGDLCVIGADTYSDYREQMVPLEECARTRAAYGDEVGLPVAGDAFVQHVRGLLTDAAKRTDDAYPENAFFEIVNGRPKLGRQAAKTTPAGFEQLDQALTRKLDALSLSLLDVLADTSQWIDWDRHFSPLSGHDSKLREQARRKILTVFAYGTGLGPTQTARNIADISARQISFVDQRQVSTEKLESSLCDIINAYNRFQLPRYWGDPKHAAADGTQWNLYENNLLSERHIRYGGYGGIAYYHVSDVYIALFSHFIPCGVWEAIHILDGLTKNDSDIQPDILHGNTQAQSATVYGLAFLLGIKLMPRIRNWKDLKWFRPMPVEAYQHIDSLFTKEAVDWDLIACHLPDMLQVAHVDSRRADFAVDHPAQARYGEPEKQALLCIPGTGPGGAHDLSARIHQRRRPASCHPGGAEQMRRLQQVCAVGVFRLRHHRGERTRRSTEDRQVQPSDRQSRDLP